MGRRPCCDKIGLKKGKWTAEEDEKLVSYIKANGEGSWRSMPKNAGLLRCGKSCRLRWINYLRDDLKRGNITPEEEETIIKLQASLGNRWSLIASHLTGRTDNEIKNHWNSHLSYRVRPDPPIKKKRGRKAKSATATTAGTTTPIKKNKKSKHQKKSSSLPKDESIQEATNNVNTNESGQSSPESTLVVCETLTVTTPDGSGATSSANPTEIGGSNGEGDQVDFDMGGLEGLLGDDDFWKEMEFEQLSGNGCGWEGEENFERCVDWDLYFNNPLF